MRTVLSLLDNHVALHLVAQVAAQGCAAASHGAILAGPGLRARSVSCGGFLGAPALTWEYCLLARSASMTPKYIVSSVALRICMMFIWYACWPLAVFMKPAKRVSNNRGVQGAQPLTVLEDERDAVAHVVVAALVGLLGHQAGHALLGHGGQHVVVEDNLIPSHLHATRQQQRGSKGRSPLPPSRTR